MVPRSSRGAGAIFSENEMTEFVLSSSSLIQAQKAINERTYKVVYNTDTRLLDYFYVTEYRKNPATSSPFWTDYSEFVNHVNQVEIFKTYKTDECRSNTQIDGIILRKLNGHDTFILENIPVDEIHEPSDIENHIHSEILKIEFDKLGINCDIELRNFNNIRKVIYQRLRKSDNTEDFTYATPKISFRQFVITPKTETDLVQFLFYFNDFILNGVRIQ